MLSIFGLGTTKAKINSAAKHAREELSPEETLIICGKAKSNLGISILMLSTGFFFVYYGTSCIFGNITPFIMLIIILLIPAGGLLLYVAIAQLFNTLGDYYFVTDRRLCVRSINIMGKIKRQDFPPEMICSAGLKTIVYDDADSGTTYCDIIEVQTKGRTINLEPVCDLEALLEAIKMLSSPSRP